MQENDGMLTLAICFMVKDAGEYWNAWNTTMCIIYGDYFGNIQQMSRDICNFSMKLRDFLKLTTDHQTIFVLYRLSWKIF